jgi:hypothetical protein
MGIRDFFSTSFRPSVSEMFPPSQCISGDLSQKAQRLVVKAGHFFRPNKKFENFLRITPTLLVFPSCLVSRTSEKFSPQFFFRLRKGTFPLNQNVDNLHKHVELFPFSELLVKFPRISDDILLTLASDTKTKRMHQVEEKQYKELQNWEQMVAVQERKGEIWRDENMDNITGDTE